MNGINQKAVLRVNADGDVVKCAKSLDANKCGWKAGDKVCGACGAMAVMTKGGMGVPEMEDEDEEMVEVPTPRKKPVVMVEEETEDIPEEESDNSVEELEQEAKLKNYRKMRLGGMGVKDATGDEGNFVCGINRKMLDAGTEPCEGCTGGCFPVKGMPDLLAIEGMAMEQFGGKVLDSGYSSQYDTFVVDVRRKDGRVIEAYYNGQGESEGWHPLPEDVVAYDEGIVGGDEAIVAALGQIEGKALDLGVQLVDGQPAYRVEVDGSDGYSYDVFVGLSGKVLGIDQWEYETSSIAPSFVKDELTASLMEFEALAAETELRDSGLL